MLRTFAYLAYFWLLLIVGLILFPPYLLMRLFRLRRLWRPYVIAVAGAWGRHLLYMAGARVEVAGLENLPAHDRLCFVSNHQSYLDILLITGYIPKTVGILTAIRELKGLGFQADNSYIGCSMIPKAIW